MPCATRPHAAQLGRLWRTVRWLRTGQLVGRLRIKLQRPRPDLRPAPPLRPAKGTWLAPPARAASLLGPSRWRLLNEEHDLADIGWDAPAVSLLWRYNQHYFDDLNADGAVARRSWHQALLQRWCSDNPPGRGTAWAPYPTSLRIVNWVKWFLSGAPAEPGWLQSLAVQARWLCRRLEWHLLGNHLFANAKALVFAGLFFDGPEADAWLATGLAILQRELPEQILADGGQFERSPMYHALALEDVLDLINLLQARAPAASPARALLPALQRHAGAMLHWLRAMCHPGGALVRFNDCAEGIAPPTPALQAHADALGILAPQPPAQGLLHLAETGYVRLAAGRATAFLDVALIGPDYLPGHAHADTLSFELSLGERELIVNRGTSIYGDGPRRQWERGTAAHSTVQIGALDSSEVWAGFRVGRRARPGAVQVAGPEVSARHDGYAHLRGHPLHQRRWRLEAGGLQIDDELLSSVPHAALARLHLAPGLQLAAAAADSWAITEGGRTLARIQVHAGQARATQTLHALHFGRCVQAATLEVALAQGRCSVRIEWTA